MTLSPTRKRGERLTNASRSPRLRVGLNGYASFARCPRSLKYAASASRHGRGVATTAVFKASNASTLYGGRRAGVGYSLVGIGVSFALTLASSNAAFANSYHVAAPEFVT